MNYPFLFTFDDADQVGLIFNPHAAPVSSSKPNQITDALGAGGNLMVVGLMPPTGEIILTGFSLMTDATGDAPVGIGFYDTVADGFVELYRVPATDAAGGGIARDLGDGFHLPLGPTRVLGITCYTTAGEVSGDVRFVTTNDRAAEGATQYAPVLDSLGTPVLDSDYNPIYQG